MEESGHYIYCGTDSGDIVKLVVTADRSKIFLQVQTCAVMKRGRVIGGGGGGGGQMEVVAPVTVEGLYAQLEQKDKDLTLAAELGNVLLEKNEELRRQNEALEKEFAENVEVGRKGNDFRRG